MPPVHPHPSDELGRGPIDAQNPGIEASFRTSLIHVEHRDNRSRTRYHCQPGVEIHLTVEGHALFHVGGRNHPQSPGQGMVLRGHNPHQFISDPTFRFQRTVVCFVPSDFAATARGEHLLALDWLPQNGGFPFALNEQEFARADELARWLRYEVNFQLPGWRDTAFGLLLNLLAIVQRNGDAGAPPASGGYRCELVSNVCAHLRKNLVGDLSLQSVARRFKVSPEHLTRSFRRRLGISFHRYMLVERITAAKELLRGQPHKSVTDVAFETGFESPGHFSKVFKKHTRLTPTQFRETDT
ncbi:MAG: AraC family transcriptional regulator [Rariglobus sp.]|nr:AraC family transcriptional regulator [Rariglobus sp.]